MSLAQTDRNRPLEQIHSNDTALLLYEAFQRVIAGEEIIRLSLSISSREQLSTVLLKVCDRSGLVCGALLLCVDTEPADMMENWINMSNFHRSIPIALCFQDEQGGFQWGNGTFLEVRSDGPIKSGVAIRSLYPPSCVDELVVMDEQVLATLHTQVQDFRLDESLHRVVKHPFVVDERCIGIVTIVLLFDSFEFENYDADLFSADFIEPDNGCLLIGPDGQIQACNAGAANLLGIEALLLDGVGIDQVFRQLEGTESMSQLLCERRQWQGKVVFSSGAWVDDARTCRAYMISRSSRGGGLLILLPSECVTLDEDSLMHSWLACHDITTGLPNSTATLTRLEHSINQSDRSLTFVGVLYLDLDHFRDINQRLGRALGDRVLSALAASLQSSLRKGDTLGRVAGDAFLVALEQLNGLDGIKRVRQKTSSLLEKIGIDYIGEPLTASIGVAIAPEDGTEAIGLIHKAHLAMCEAKRLGRDQVCYFSTLRYPIIAE